MTNQRRPRPEPRGRQRGRTRTPRGDVDPPPDPPDELEPDPADPPDSDGWEFEELPCTDADDADWDAFLPDDDERNPEPEPGDFWIESSSD